MPNENLQKAISAFAIRSVGLVEARIETNRERWLDPNVFEALQIRNRQKPLGYGTAELTAEGESPQKIYRFFFELGFKMLEQEENEQSGTENAGEETSFAESIVGSVTAVYFAEYVLSDTQELDEESIGAFGTMNALYHIWPYWREYVSSSLNRMRLPNFQVPMFRLPVEHQREESGANDGCFQTQDAN